ncbi:MAG: hypothetical protein KC933_30550 [Myxococcales bacterium]|nr:hypothetical protein [Myxococcales bacterium]
MNDISKSQQRQHQPTLTEQSIGDRQQGGRAEGAVSALTAEAETAVIDMENSVNQAFWEAQKDGLTMAESVQLKTQMDRMMAAINTMSGVMKKGHETSMAIIKNMA